MAPEQMADGPEGAVPLAPPRPLDAIDQDILQMLQADGRASIRSVAERVHVSRANAYARINRLVEDGVIRGFGARVNHERAGQGTSAYITLKIVQNSWRTVREQLRQLPGASHIALVGGDFDVILLVRASDARDLRQYGYATGGASEVWDAYWVPQRDRKGRTTGKKTNVIYTTDLVRGLDVYEVATLDQAVTDLETIASGKSTSGLARCGS